YELFVAPFEQDISWSAEGIKGARRFLNRIWSLYKETYYESVTASGIDQELERLLHKTIRQVSERIDGFRFNMVVSALMEFTNALKERQRSGNWRSETFDHALETLLILLAPVVPHISEELWHLTRHNGSVLQQSWPNWDDELAREETEEIAIQVDGKLRGVITVEADMDEANVKEQAIAHPKVQQHIAGREISKIYYVPGRIVNIVTRR
ncbi:MAG TPA: leucine--tRNA ligase, partial [bacterium]|nr:leucine--tRNA ligase [bacterium]